MKLNRVLLVVSCSLIGVGSLSAQAASEPTLKSILKAEYNSTWKQISFSDLVNSSWNTAGTTLNFSLISENADFASINSFLIRDNGISYTAFAGSATPTSYSSFSYVLTDELSRIYFKTGTENSNKYRVYFNNAIKEYAFAYEDVKGSRSDNDYNDMVITMKATVAAVPEPEVMGMMMAGLGLTGFMVRRRKQA